MHPTPISHWHKAVAARDFSAIEELLADDVVFQSPAVHTPQTGKAVAAKYLRAAMFIFDDPSFRYVDEWFSKDSAVLEFEVTLDGTYVNGIDLIRWNEDGLICNFKVMVRPLKALNALVSQMAVRLQGSTAP